MLRGGSEAEPGLIKICMQIFSLISVGVQASSDKKLKVVLRRESNNNKKNYIYIYIILYIYIYHIYIYIYIYTHDIGLLI